MKTASQYFEDLFEEFNNNPKTKTDVTYEEAIKEPQYEMYINNIKQAQLDTLKAMEEECISKSEDVHPFAVEHYVSESNITDCANTIKAKIERGVK